MSGNTCFGGHLPQNVVLNGLNVQARIGRYVYFPSFTEIKKYINNELPDCLT